MRYPNDHIRALIETDKFVLITTIGEFGMAQTTLVPVEYITPILMQALQRPKPGAMADIANILFERALVHRVMHGNIETSEPDDDDEVDITVPYTFQKASINLLAESTRAAFSTFNAIADMLKDPHCARETVFKIANDLVEEYIIRRERAEHEHANEFPHDTLRERIRNTLGSEYNFALLTYRAPAIRAIIYRTASEGTIGHPDGERHRLTQWKPTDIDTSPEVRDSLDLFFTDVEYPSTEAPTEAEALQALLARVAGTSSILGMRRDINNTTHGWRYALDNFKYNDVVITVKK